MKLYNLKYYLFAMITFMVSCKEETMRTPIEGNDQAPGAVTNIEVENLPGKAMISYEVPVDKDLLYVRAKYRLATGQEMEVKSSYYNNYLVVEGFAEEEEHEVILYSVNKSEVESQPVPVTIRPLRAPIWDTFNSLVTAAAFGGVRMEANNLDRANLA